MTEALLTAAAPVFTVDGTRRGELARDVVKLVVEEATDGLKTLRARFLAFGPRSGRDEEDLLYLDGEVFDFGRELEVAIGPAANPRIIFRGKVSGLEAAFEEGQEPEVAVYAEDEAMSLRMTRRMRTYEEMSDAEIAAEIAAEHGLVPETDADGPTYDRVQQWNQSDLAFLRDRGRRIQAEVWVRQGRLFFQSRGRRSAPELVLVRGNHILSIEVVADLAHQRTAVRIGGYDAKTREAIDEEATDDAVQAEIAGGRTGAKILQNAFGERVSYRLRDTPLTTAEASAFARAEMLRRGRGFVQACGTTRGIPDLVVGSRLRLERVGKPFEGGGYYATRVCHTFDLDSGHRTHFTAERATLEETS